MRSDRKIEPNLPVILCVFFILQIAVSMSCSNKSDSPAYPKFRFEVNVPGAPNKSFSAYLFANGTLVGGVLSNNMTDSTGKLIAGIKKVDANNCITSEDLIPANDATFNMHYRLDYSGSGSFVYPTACPSSAGFSGMNTTYGGEWLNAAYSSSAAASVFQISQPLNSQTQLSNLVFTLQSTGLNAVSRLSYCNLLDGGVSSPNVNNATALGFSQNTLTYTAGNGGTNLTGITAYIYSGTPLKYACWIDATNNGSYNSGDLIASGTVSTSTITVSSWVTVP